MIDPHPEPLTAEEIAALMFAQLEIALYGKTDNTWEKQRADSVMALLRQWVDSHERLRAQVASLTAERDEWHEAAP